MWLQNILLWTVYLFVGGCACSCRGEVFACVHVCGGSSNTSEPVHVKIRVCSYLMVSGRASHRDRGSQIKLDCMVLPGSQVLSPAPTWPLRIICNFSCKGFSTLFWPLCVPDMYVVYLHICRQNTHTYKIKISTFLNIKYQPWPWHC